MINKFRVMKAGYVKKMPKWMVRKQEENIFCNAPRLRPTPWRALSLQSPPNTKAYFALEDINVAWKFEEFAESQRASGRALWFHSAFISLCLTIERNILSPAQKNKKPESIRQSLCYWTVWAKDFIYQNIYIRVFYFTVAYANENLLWSYCPWQHKALDLLPAPRFPRNPNPTAAGSN